MSSNDGDAIDAYVRKQISARRVPAVVKIEFLNFRSIFPTGLVLVVEGDDDKVVYSYWISRLRPELAYEFFVCGGKRGVRSLRNSLFADRGDANESVGFLVDRDFDELSGFTTDMGVFMLDRYSIENYLVEVSVVSETIRVAYPGHFPQSVRDAACALFESSYDQFVEAVAELNEAIYIGRKLYRDIDDVIPRSTTHLALVEIDRVQKLPASTEKKLVIDPKPSKEEEEELKRQFSLLSGRSRYRGKYALKFLFSWFEKLSREFHNPVFGIFPPAVSGSAIKQSEIALGPFSCRSPIPCGLDDFLDAVAGAA